MNGQEDIQYHAKVFFMRAAEFLEAADELFASENRTPLKWWYPTYFLYAHATELALKAFWRAHNLLLCTLATRSNDYAPASGAGPDARRRIHSAHRVWRRSVSLASFAHCNLTWLARPGPLCRALLLPQCPGGGLECYPLAPAALSVR